MLHWAANYGHEEVVKLLLEKGADIRIRTVDDWTPLQLAAGEGQESVFRILLNAGVTVGECY